MRVLRIVMLALTLMPAAGVIAQTQQAAQAEGSNFGASARTSGPLTPSALTSAATTQGADNVWGSGYTGQADSALTGQANAPSMIGIGSNARNKSVTGFTSYNDNRADQANQATYFLDINPPLKPTLSAGDPMLSTSNINGSTDIFASSTAKVCKQETITQALDNKNIQTCSETFNPYVISCSKDTSIVLKDVDYCPTDKQCTRTQTCNTGQSYRLSMGDNTGMGGDGFLGGDYLGATWTCSIDDVPAVTMDTGSRTYGTIYGTVKNNESIVVISSGYNRNGTAQAVRFVNNTKCSYGKCDGVFIMILGQLNRYGQFTERSYGAASRIIAYEKFSMATIQSTEITTTSSCLAIEGLAQP
jgi:hypothetical protein